MDRGAYISLGLPRSIPREEKNPADPVASVFTAEQPRSSCDGQVDSAVRQLRQAWAVASVLFALCNTVQRIG